MFFKVAGFTDKGGTRPSNQDAFTVKVVQSIHGQAAFAVMCDGMGGLSRGEVASAKLVQAFEAWFQQDLAELLEQGVPRDTLEKQWIRLIHTSSQDLLQYGAQEGIRLGTTATALLVTEQRYYLLHVGDCRAYCVNNEQILQLTSDQTVAAEELRAGRITLDHFREDKRQHILLQCIGASDTVCPDFFCGECIDESMFLLCSDGFYHTLTESELRGLFRGQGQSSWLNGYLHDLGQLCRQRGEQDNLSALVISRCRSSCAPTQMMEETTGEKLFHVLSDYTKVSP